MKKYIKNSFNMIIVLLILFTVISCIFNTSYAAVSLERALNNLDNRIDFETDVSVTTVLICFILIIVFVILIITFILLRKKIPSTALYLIIATLVIGISVIATIYGDEILMFCDVLMEIQMNVVNDRMLNIQ